jgi:hypothetical protein
MREMSLMSLENSHIVTHPEMMGRWQLVPSDLWGSCLMIQMVAYLRCVDKQDEGEKDDWGFPRGKLGHVS